MRDTFVSVVLTSYDLDRYDDLCSSLDSIFNQSYKDFEIIFITESKEIYERIESKYDSSKLKSKLVNESLNLSEARNRGSRVANGDLIVFTDDDVIADKNWLLELVKSYEKDDDISGVGGYCKPIWVDKKPFYVPSEFYWVFGVTHTNHPQEGKVRNTFGCNIGFDSNIFDELGGFYQSLGKDHGKKLQGEETEFCSRMRNIKQKNIYYNPRAIILHKVYSDQVRFKYIIERCFWQGYTKKVIGSKNEDSLDTEQSYLKDIFRKSIPKYLKEISKLNNIFSNTSKLFMLFLLTSFVGLGFLYGYIK
jgi:glycosyltransferase involved in cell wall biosynthesis